MSEDAIKEKCGLFGIWGIEKASEYAYLALHNLQHRGQESCGIVSVSERKFHSCHGMGLVNEVFSRKDISALKGKTSLRKLYLSATDVSDLSPIKGLGISELNLVSTQVTDLSPAGDRRPGAFCRPRA